MSTQQNPNRVAGGLKAAVHNPNVPEETKASATERLQNMGVELESGNQPKSASEGRSGGRYQEDDDDAAFEDEVGNDGTSSAAGGGETNRVLGGYKATLKNPNVSSEAKRHAEQVLKDSDAI